MEKETAKQWQIFSTLYIFCAVYASLHKIFIPLSLKFFSVNVEAYSRLDFRVLPSIGLAVLLARRGRFDRLSSFLAGLTVVYGVVEVIAGAMGEFSGWLYVSHMISAVPLSIMAIALLSVGKSGFTAERSYKFAWLGAATVLLGFSLDMGVLRRFKAPLPKEAQVMRGQVTEGEEKPGKGVSEVARPQCGAQEFEISTASAVAAKSNGEIVLDTCGLAPVSVAFREGEHFFVTNRLKQSMNAHLVYFDDKGSKRNWNRILKPKERSQIAPQIDWSKIHHALLFSDTKASAGVVFLYPHTLRSRFLVKRTPPSIEEILP